MRRHLRDRDAGCKCPDAGTLAAKETDIALGPGFTDTHRNKRSMIGNKIWNPRPPVSLSNLMPYSSPSVPVVARRGPSCSVVSVAAHRRPSPAHRPSPSVALADRHASASPGPWSPTVTDLRRRSRPAHSVIN